MRPLKLGFSALVLALALGSAAGPSRASAAQPDGGDNHQWCSPSECPPVCNPKQCPAPDNATAYCLDNQCAWRCDDGYAKCGSECRPTSGCCTASQCPSPANGSAVCSDSGVCGFTCNAGYTPCGAACVPVGCTNSCGTPGSTVCESGGGTHCSTPNPAEVCNGLDDDCNGQIDEGDVCNQAAACH